MTKQDLAYAQTRDGRAFPVIDVTDPRFAVADDPESLRSLMGSVAREEAKRRRVPKFIMRLMIKWLARRSLLARALFAGTATFLDGLTTYVMKLGPDVRHFRRYSSGAAPQNTRNAFNHLA